MSDEEKVEKVESGAGTGQPDNYSDRRAAYKRELQEALVSVPAGANMGYLIVELRKKHGLGMGYDKQVVDSAPPQGNWSLVYLQERHTKRMAQEAEARGGEQKEADNKKRLEDLKARLIRAQFQKPKSFTWPAESRDVLRPFELAKDHEIWACFSLLKILLREVLASEFNLTGAEVDLIRFMGDAKIYPGGEKQLLADALLALRSFLCIMLSKPEPEKPNPKADKPVVKVQSAPVAPTERRRRAQSAELKQAESSVVSSGKTELKPEVSVKSVLAPKREFGGFQWTNKFRKTLGVIKPMASNEELEKAFILLSLQYQKAIVFRFRIAQPAVSLKELMAGGLKRGVEEFVKKAMEELRQKVLAVRREEGVSVKPSVLVEPELKLSQPMPLAPALSKKSGEPEITFPAEEVKVGFESLLASTPEVALKAASKTELFRLPKDSETNFETLASAMWNSKAKDKAWQELRQDSSLLESREILAEILTQLSKEQVQVLSLRYENGLSWKQIGQVLKLGMWQYSYGYFFRAIGTIATLLRRLKVDFPSRRIRTRVPAKLKPAKANKKTPYAEKKRLIKENEKEVKLTLSQANLAKIKKLLWPEGGFLESSQQLASFFSRSWRKGKLMSTKEGQVFFFLVGEEDLSEKQIAQRIGCKVGAVYCAKSLILKKLRAFCFDLRKELGLEDDLSDKNSQESWIETVLEAGLREISEIEFLLSQILLSRVYEALGPEGRVFERAEQFAPLLLQPGKYGISLTEAQAKIFLLSFWQERIKARKIKAKGGLLTKPVYHIRHHALKKIKAVAQQIVEAGISAEEFLKKALALSKPKAEKRGQKITFAHFGAFLILWGLQLMPFGYEEEAVISSGHESGDPARLAEVSIGIAVVVCEANESGEDEYISPCQEDIAQLAVRSFIPKNSHSLAARLLRSTAFQKDVGRAVSFNGLDNFLAGLKRGRDGKDKTKALLLRYCAKGKERRSIYFIVKKIGWSAPTIKKWIQTALAEIRAKAEEGQI